MELTNYREAGRAFGDQQRFIVCFRLVGLTVKEIADMCLTDEDAITRTLDQFGRRERLLWTLNPDARRELDIPSYLPNSVPY